MKQLYSIIFILFSISVIAQNDAINKGSAEDTTAKQGVVKKLLSKKSSEPEKGKLYIIVVPAIASSPSTGFLYGIASTASMYLGDPKTTQMSTGVSALTNTTKHQLMFSLRTKVFLKDNKWLLWTDIRLQKTSQPTYGLGTGPQSRKLATNGFRYDDNLFSKPIDTAQMLHYNWTRIHQTVLKKVRRNLYIGVGYHLDMYRKIDDKLLDLDTTNGNVPVFTSHWLYNAFWGFSPSKTTLSGVSANFLYDSRDNPATPYKGEYALITFKYFPTYLGSDQNAGQLWAEYRHYFSVSKKDPSHIIGFWAFSHLSVFGHTPYLDLPSLGYDTFARSGRGYTIGRFRGEQLFYTEVEYRFPIKILANRPDLLAGVVFANFTTATNNAARVYLMNYIEPGVGVGLRILINKKTRSHLTIDYAWGNYGSHGFYFNINESF